MSNMYFYLRDLHTERQNMSEPPVPKLEQLQIPDAYEKCLCGHNRGSHTSLSGPCNWPVPVSGKPNVTIWHNCTCTEFRAADDQGAKACAATGSR